MRYPNTLALLAVLVLTSAFASEARAACTDYPNTSGSCLALGNTKCIGNNPYSCKALSFTNWCYQKTDTCTGNEVCKDPTGPAGAQCMAPDPTCSDYSNTSGSCTLLTNTKCISGHPYQCKDLGPVWCYQKTDTCSSGEFCTDPAIGGAKCVECTSDGHCASNETCESNKCVPASCSDYSNTSGSCVLLSNTKCISGDPYKCKDLGPVWCYQKTDTCSGSEVCTDPAVGSAQCVDCTKDSQCASNETCDDYQCVPASCGDYSNTSGSCTLLSNTKCISGDPYQCKDLGPVWCYQKTDSCSGSEVCTDPVIGGAKCVDCTKDSHCASNETCDNNQCVPASCGDYSNTSGSCTLLSNTKCISGHPYQCKDLGPVWCYQKTDTCSGSEVCTDPVIGGAKCVDCTKDSQCASNETCDNNQCVPASCGDYPSTSGSCTLLMNTKCIGGDPYQCKDLGPVWCYQKTASCAAGEVCTDPVVGGAKCVQCAEDAHCGSGETCESNVCVAASCSGYPNTSGSCALLTNTKCISNNPYQCKDLGPVWCYQKIDTCTGDELCEDPTGPTGAQCVLPAAECGDFANTSGSCVLLSNTKCIEGHPYQCKDLGDVWCYQKTATCASGQLCTDPTGPSGAQCVQCIKDAHCGAGETCQSNVCVAAECAGYPNTEGSCLLLSNTKCVSGHPYQCNDLGPVWCYQKTDTCTPDEVCEDPTGPTGAQCVAPDAQCADYPDTSGSCLLLSNTKCISDDPYKCQDLGEVWCYQKIATCAPADYCVDPLTAGAQCVECTEDAHCGAGGECKSYECVGGTPLACGDYPNAVGACSFIGQTQCKSGAPHQCTSFGAVQCWAKTASCEAGTICASDGSACIPDPLGQPCGDVTDDGECDGDTLSKCVAGYLEVTDCTLSAQLCTVDSGSGEADCTEAVSPCTDVPAEGLCVGEVLVTCEGGALQNTDCAAQALTCAFHEPTGVYACIEAVVAACNDVPAEGVCIGDMLALCVDGAVQNIDCAAEGKVCGLDAIQGANACLTPAMGCDALPPEGECADGVLYYCDGGLPASIDCAAFDLECAYDEGQGWYDCLESCTGSCEGKACGTDGCGVSCGACGDGQLCSAEGACVDVAGPCGAVTADGECQGDVLRECVGGQLKSTDCAATGKTCELVEDKGWYDCVGAAGCDCATKQCGKDGCGGSCGACAGDETCTADGQCVSGCGDVGQTGTCQGEVLVECAGGALLSTDCAGKGKTCQFVQEHQWFDCVSDDPGNCECAGKQCGKDGCGGTCGSCTDSQTCSPTGQCVAGCGGVSYQGACDGTVLKRCVAGTLIESDCAGANKTCAFVAEYEWYDCIASGACVGDCVGKACGPDGCGGSCGACDATMLCTSAGQCDDPGGAACADFPSAGLCLHGALYTCVGGAKQATDCGDAGCGLNATGDAYECLGDAPRPGEDSGGVTTADSGGGSGADAGTGPSVGGGDSSGGTPPPQDIVRSDGSGCQGGPARSSSPLGWLLLLTALLGLRAARHNSMRRVSVGENVSAPSSTDASSDVT